MCIRSHLLDTSWLIFYLSSSSSLEKKESDNRVKSATCKGSGPSTPSSKQGNGGLLSCLGRGVRQGVIGGAALGLYSVARPNAHGREITLCQGERERRGKRGCCGFCEKDMPSTLKIEEKRKMVTVELMREEDPRALGFLQIGGEPDI